MEEKMNSQDNAAKKSPLDKVEEMITIGLTNHTTEVRKELEGLRRKVLREGMYNGSQGIKLTDEEVKTRAQRQAESYHSELTVLVEKKIRESTENEADAKIEHERAQDDLNNRLMDEGYYTRVSTFTTDGLNKMSQMIFIAGALFLLVADIVLSVQLVSVGFGFTLPEEDAEFSKLMVNPGQVMAANWQPILTALGLTLLTVSLKYVFDRFILAPFGSGYMKRFRFFQLFRHDAKIIPASKFDKGLIVCSEIFKGLVMIALAACVIILFYIMADFRSSALEISALDTKYNEDYNAVALPGNAGILKRAELTKIYSEQRKILTDAAKDNTRNTFLLLTLLMPIVSAVCFSVAGLYSKTRAKLKILSEEIAIAKNRKKESQNAATAKGAECDAWRREKLYLQADGWISSFTDQLVNLYQYGFRFGSIRPDLLQDIQDKLATVERYRNKRVFFITNRSLINLNQKPNEN